MTKIKLCGLSAREDVAEANRLKPEYIGFVFAPGSRRYVEPGRAAALREVLDPAVTAVGVFVREKPERVAQLLNVGIIDMAQLHGGEDETYIHRLRELTDRPLIRAFRVEGPVDAAAAQESSADYVLLDSGSGGTGTVFDWSLLSGMKRPFFLAGGLHDGNVEEALRKLSPYAVDVSSGIETDGRKDPVKMAAFVRAVRENKN